jgi:hypothetical protein
MRWRRPGERFAQHQSAQKCSWTYAFTNRNDAEFMQ